MPPVCDLDNQSIGGKRSKLSRMIGGNSWWRTKGGGGFWPLSATGFLSTHRDSATLTPPPRCPNLPAWPRKQTRHQPPSHRDAELPKKKSPPVGRASPRAGLCRRPPPATRRLARTLAPPANLPSHHPSSTPAPFIAATIWNSSPSCLMLAGISPTACRAS